MQVHYDEGVAIHIGPEPCAGRPRGWRRSVGRGAHRPAIEPRKNCQSRVPTLFQTRKATRTGASARAPGRPGVVGDPGMCGRSLHGNREISRLTGGSMPPVRIGKARSRSR